MTEAGIRVAKEFGVTLHGEGLNSHVDYEAEQAKWTPAFRAWLERFVPDWQDEYDGDIWCMWMTWQAAWWDAIKSLSGDPLHGLHSVPAAIALVSNGGGWTDGRSIIVSPYPVKELP